MARAAGWNATRASRWATNEDSSGVTFMMTKPAHLIRRARAGIARPARGLAAVLVLLGLLAAGPALAANTLEGVSATPLPGGKVQVTLTFSGPATAPQAFSTNTPPRIALDFADTSNGLKQRQLPINQGTAQAVSAVEAGGRTRVVVDLSQPSAYVTSVAGNDVVVTIGNGMGAATAGAPAEAAPEAAALAPVPPPPPTQMAYAGATDNPAKAVPLASGNVITAVDFRRGEHGAGKLVVDFSAPGAATSMHASGDTTTIQIAGASLAASQARRLDVTDYATPVRSINTHPVPGGARIDVDTRGVVQTAAYQSGNEYVVEFSPPAPEANNLLGAPKPVVYKGSRVTFNFQDIPVRSVLQLLADVSGLNIVASDSVRGNVTLRLVNVPWDQALDVILRAKCLAKRQNGNVIWVAPQTELAEYEQSIADARQKQLEGSQLVNDTPEKVQEIRQLVSVLDRPVQQVLIESRLVIATDNFTRELGARLGVGGFHLGDNSRHAQIFGGSASDVTSTATSITNYWNSILQPGSTSSSSGSNNLPTIPTGLNVNLPSTTTGTSSFAIGILGKDYLLNLELSAAQQEGRSETISQPKVVTANNQEATIQQGTQIGYLTFQNSGAGGGQGTATVQFKNAVLELDVTPTITSDNRVFMKLKVIKDALNQLVPNPGGGFVPQIDHREIDTSVLVDNGQTVVLGGVYEFQNETDVTKVPFLGDIPILGALFRDKKNINNKAELLVFITPHILGQETTVE